jgi:Tol biopolymer transport system component
LGNGTEVVVATRATVAANFGALAVVAGVNTAANDFDPTISTDGLVLMFSSRRNAGEIRIFRSSRATTAASFGTPVELTELNGTDAGGPVLSADGLEIFFYSTRSGGSGVTDIWFATRGSANDPFGAPMNLAEVNGATADFPSWLSPDRCRLLVTSDRLGGPDLYIATRPQ